MALFFAASRVVKALRRVNRASNDDPTCDDCEGCQLHDICKDREKKK